MNKLGMTRDAPADSAFRSNGTAPSDPEQRAVVDSSNALTIIGTFASQVVLITAFFYYFGWVETNSFLGYFGVDPSLVGYSTSDYVLRSINVAFHPFIDAAFTALGLFGFHRLVVAPVLMNAKLDPPPPLNTATSDEGSPAIPRAAWPGSRWAVGSVVGWAQAWGHWRPRPSDIRRFMGTLQTVAIVLAAAVLTGVLLPEQIGARIGLLLPLLLIISVILFGYVAHLRSRYQDAPAETTPLRSTPPSRAYTLTLLALGLVAGLWAVSLYGDHVGTRLGAEMVTQLPAQSGIVIYSTERIALHGHGIIVTEITQPGTKYHYQYTGLRLLARSPDKFLLLPSLWQHGQDRVLLLQDNDSIRVDIAAR
ncbi:MAG TPA: hypothetical protein VHY21_20340 [Pseudonocardiaceae bacterium]|nr:hypothetical protein [Pseudonocardiaceae bacterium]